MELLYKDESYKIVGAAMTVHKELGSGFLEPVYQDAIEIEFKSLSIPYQREVVLPIYYKNILLSKTYIADFVCYDKIIVELKAVSSLTSVFRAQVLNYLKASKLELGLLLNFGTDKLEQERIIRVHSRNSLININDQRMSRIDANGGAPC